MTFRGQEKQRYKAIKPRLFPPEACFPGNYHDHPRVFCLPDTLTYENLYCGFQFDAIGYFRERGIGWHDGLPDHSGNKKGFPSNHLCCSQSACVNVLWPMVVSGELLAKAFRPFFPELKQVLPFDADLPLKDGRQPFLVFEWTGTQNYLGEVGNRQRGANATGGDFAFRFLRYDGRVQLVLGEWKYTESYPVKVPDPNPTRRRVYREAFERWQARQPHLPGYEHFFVEPLYQLMRLTLLAQEIENAKGDGEMQADIVSALVVSPKANREYRERFTSPVFSQYGRTICDAWFLLAPQDRFLSISTESLLTVIEQVAPPGLCAWEEYLSLRYGWWKGLP